MQKIINKKKDYQSRSKNVSFAKSACQQNENTKKLRENYKVNDSGYFVWDSSNRPKKI